MFLGLRTAIYPVLDLALAKAWYIQILGVQPYFDQPFYVGFSVGGFELGLIPGKPGVEGAQPLWGVTNADAAMVDLLAAGGVELEPVTAVGEGIRVGAVKDPFGNRLGFIENPKFVPGDLR